MTEEIVAKKVRKKASDRRRDLRKALWPDVEEADLWLRSQRVGFTTIPRAMPLLGQILDQLSGKGFPLFSTYLTLWCWVYDEGIVEIRNAKELAHEAGFSGPRAESTWRSRMKKLEELGFVMSRPGLAGDFQYVLLMNPFKRIRDLYSQRLPDALYTALLGRLAQIGADNLDV